jgi:hypothetical protein
MKGRRNHHLRLLNGRFYVVVRNGDHDIKICAGDNIASARETRDDLLRSLGRLKPLTKKQRAVLEEIAEPEPKRLARRVEDYYAGGCVLLLAAVYKTQEALEWAMDSLHAARAIDARRFA